MRHRRISVFLIIAALTLAGCGQGAALVGSRGSSDDGPATGLTVPDGATPPADQTLPGTTAPAEGQTAPGDGVATTAATGFLPPKGLYVTLRDSKRSFSVGRWDGGTLLIGWKALEPRRGQYDFSVLLQRLREARAANKRLAIRLMAGVHSPDWVFTDSSILKVRFHDPYNDNHNVSGGTYTIPAPWRRDFLQLYVKMLNALNNAIAPYAAQVAYVSVSGANDLWAEECWPKTSEDFNDWKSKGYDPLAYVDTLVWLLDQHAGSLSPSIGLGLHFAGANFYPKGGLEPAKRLLKHGVAAYGKRLVSRNNALQDGISVDPNGDSQDKIAAFRYPYRNQIVLLYQYQPAMTSNWLATGRNAAQNLGASMLEVPRGKLEDNPSGWLDVRRLLLQNGP